MSEPSTTSTPARTVAIVGRPNVGKSALFNRLAGRKIAIVHDMPGVTRDRISATCSLGRAPFRIVDTGGIGSDVDTSFTTQVRTEAEIAMETADAIVLVVDAQEGLTPVDRDLARLLRRVQKPVLLAINKVDHPRHEPLASDFDTLGFELSFEVSAEHNRGIADLVSALEARLPPPSPTPDTRPEPIHLAIVGRPNVGKSSLINAILDDARTIVSDIAGTTRDAVDVPYRRGNQEYVLIDTAGIRARGKVRGSVEVFSVMRSEKSIARADLCVMVIDASAGVTAMDRKIAGLIQEARKPCIIALNKWDLVRPPRADRKETIHEKVEDARANLFFLSYAPVVLLSAKTGEHVSRLFKAVDRVRRGAWAHIGTGPFNRLLQELQTNAPPPVQSGRRLKILYGAQSDTRGDGPIPRPAFTFFVNDGRLLADHYRKFIEGRIRAIEPFEGVPLTFRFRGRSD